MLLDCYLAEYYWSFGLCIIFLIYLYQFPYLFYQLQISSSTVLFNLRDNKIVVYKKNYVIKLIETTCIARVWDMTWLEYLNYISPSSIYVITCDLSHWTENNLHIYLQMQCLNVD